MTDGYCAHGVPWLYVCADGDHEQHDHHRCDEVPKLSELSPEQRAVIAALIAAQESADKAAKAPQTA